MQDARQWPVSPTMKPALRLHSPEAAQALHSACKSTHASPAVTSCPLGAFAARREFGWNAD